MNTSSFLSNPWVWLCLYGLAAYTIGRVGLPTLYKDIKSLISGIKGAVSGAKAAVTSTTTKSS